MAGVIPSHEAASLSGAVDPDVVAGWGLSAPAIRRIAVLIPPLLVVASGLAVVMAIRAADRAEVVVTRTYATILELQSLQARLTDAETATRGFLLTGDEPFLEPLEGARAEADSALRAMGQLVVDPTQRDRLGALAPLVRARLDHADSIVARRRAGSLPDEQVVQILARGKSLMDQVRARIAQLRDGQLRLLRERAARKARTDRYLLGAVFFGTLLSVGGSLALSSLLAGYTGRVTEAAKELARQNLMLEEQAVELELQAAELEETTAELQAQDQYLTTVIDAVPDVVFAQDAAGRIRMANKATSHVLGIPVISIVGRPHRDLNPQSEDVRQLEEQIARVIATGEPDTTERQVADPVTGARRWFTTRVVPLIRPNRGEPQVLVVATEVTEWRRAQEAVQRSQQEVLIRLSQAAEFRDDDTGEHTRRVGKLAGELARTMGLPQALADLVEQAAPLHDVGKIGIPDSILLKRGSLTPEEFDVMKTHTTIGAELLAKGESDLMHVAREIALSHHERWDGTGYPSGTTGTRIPITARIVAVADVFDALTHDRVYRPAWKLDEVFDELRRSAGSQFDPSVVDAFLRLPAEVWGVRPQ